MRLRWGPHAHETPEQVVLSDPLYVIACLDRQAGGRLAAGFRELILRFDALPLTCPCVRCGRRADAVCAYPGALALIGVCDPCTRGLRLEAWATAIRLATYEDAARHVATTFRRDHRSGMRRIVRALTAAKGGPPRLTEAAASAFLRASGSATPRTDDPRREDLSERRPRPDAAGPVPGVAARGGDRSS